LQVAILSTWAGVGYSAALSAAASAGASPSAAAAFGSFGGVSGDGDFLRRQGPDRYPVVDPVHADDDALRLVTDHGVIMADLFDRLAVARTAVVHDADPVKRAMLAAEPLETNTYCH
jgi:hypothetical protein